MDEHIGLTSVRTILFVVAIIATNFAVSSADSNTTDAGHTNGRTALQEGMEPLYKMTQGFLNVVQPKSKGNVFDALNIKADGDKLTDLAQKQDFWQDASKHYMGYLVCAVIGIVFFILMPIFGICFCCCRCCGNCGGNPDLMEKSGDRARRIVYGALLIAFSTLLLASVVCFFISNELIHEQSSKTAPNAIIPTLISNVKVLNNYRLDTIQEVKTVVGDGINVAMNNIIKDLNAAPKQAYEDISRIINSDVVLDNAEKLANRVTEINNTLASVTTLRDDLLSSQTSLSSDLSNIQSGLRNTIQTCGSECNTVTPIADDLEVDADFAQTEDVSSQDSKIRNVVNQNLIDLVKQGRTESEKIKSEVETKTADQINDIKKQTTSINTEVQSGIVETIDKVNEFDVEEYLDKLEDAKDDFEDYGNYIWYAGIGVGCIMLLVVVFYYLGLLFGFCGEVPDEDAGLCNKGAGANLLLAGVGFTFIFTWLLMLLTFIFFLSGGPVYTEACRHMSDLSDLSETQEIDKMVDNYVKVPLNLTVSTVLKECSENKALYQVADIDKTVNLLEILNISKYSGLTSELAGLKTIQVDLSTIELISRDTTNALNDLSNADLDSIDFTTYTQQLSKSVTMMPLKDAASELRSVANTVHDNTVASRLEDYARELDQLDTDTVQPMLTKKDKLSTDIDKLQTLLDTSSGTTFQDQVRAINNSLEVAEAKLQNNGSNMISRLLVSLADSVYEHAQDAANTIAHKLTHEVARCGAPFTVVQSLADSVCVNVLDPFNVIWFSIGWYIFVAVFCLFFAVWLAGLYRKTEINMDAETKSFDAPNYNAYTGGYPDNIPLHDQRNRRQGGRYDGYDNYQDNYRNGRMGHAQNPPHYYNNQGHQF